MLRIINTFQKNNFRRSWKILHGTSWVTFGFPRLFSYWYLWKCINVFWRSYLPQKNTFENGSWYSAAAYTVTEAWHIFPGFAHFLPATYTVKKAVELLDGPSKNTLLKSNKYNSKGEIVYLDTHVFFSPLCYQMRKFDIREVQ